MTKEWSCDRLRKLSRKTKTRRQTQWRPALQASKKHFQSYMRTRQKCNPEYIPLYLRSATFCWWQRSLNRPCQNGEIEEIQRTLNCWESFEQSSNFRTTQFSKRIKMESQVHFDLENFFHIKILSISWGRWKILTWEFDPGSGWTLAACLTHASRTGLLEDLFGVIPLV